jgi:hypothetical protein
VRCRGELGLDPFCSFDEAVTLVTKRDVVADGAAVLSAADLVDFERPTAGAALDAAGVVVAGQHLASEREELRTRLWPSCPC